MPESFTCQVSCKQIASSIIAIQAIKLIVTRIVFSLPSFGLVTHWFYQYLGFIIFNRFYHIGCPFGPKVEHRQLYRIISHVFAVMQSVDYLNDRLTRFKG